MQFTVNSVEGLAEVAAAFIRELSGRRIWALEGAMGAGKTTFVAEVCRQLDVEEDPASPTFSIVNEYRSRSLGESIYHFDFYRIDDPEEALDLGFDDYADSGRICLMEWSERIAPMLPEETAVLRIDVNEDGSRTITF